MIKEWDTSEQITVLHFQPYLQHAVGQASIPHMVASVVVLIYGNLDWAIGIALCAASHRRAVHTTRTSLA